MSPSLFSQHHALITILFLILGILSLYTTWGTLIRASYFPIMQRLWTSNPPCLPGSTNPVLTKYTSIPPLDKLLAFSTVLFAHITDGLMPQFSLFVFHFAGQWGCILVLVFAEGVRNGDGMLVPTIWLILLQTTTYACGMPLYCLFTTLNSFSPKENRGKGSKSSTSSTVSALQNLALAVTIGYGIPSILMSVPLENNELHQWFGGFWQGHPLWIFLVHYFLGSLKRTTPSQSSDFKANNNQTLRSASNKVYAFALATAALTHITSIAILISRTFLPDLFPAWAQESITFSGTYLPNSFWESVQSAHSDSVGHAVLDFFQYDLYFGSVTSIAWGLYMYYTAKGARISVGDAAELLGKAFGVGMLAGPSAVAAYLLWRRDLDDVEGGAGEGIEDKED